MTGDFGVEIDAALNDGLAALHKAAGEAKERVDRGLEGLETAVPGRAPAQTPPAADPSPTNFHDEPTVRVAAVSFDLPDPAPEFTLDDEGIPLPEEKQ
jgi:hypothetical protein